jgi:hypothetical protein
MLRIQVLKKLLGLGGDMGSEHGISKIIKNSSDKRDTLKPFMLP